MKNFVVEPLPRSDLVMSRDTLQHLPLDAAVAAFCNFKNSGSKWLLTNSYADQAPSESKGTKATSGSECQRS